MKLEVKVKAGDMLVDANVVIVGNVMIVTPKATLSTKKEEEKRKPKVGEYYYYPEYNESGVFQAESYRMIETTDLDNSPDYRRGWIFKTWDECYDFCCKLNDILRYVTP